MWNDTSFYFLNPQRDLIPPGSGVFLDLEIRELLWEEKCTRILSHYFKILYAEFYQINLRVYEHLKHLTLRFVTSYFISLLSFLPSPPSLLSVTFSIYIIKHSFSYYIYHLIAYVGNYHYVLDRLINQLVIMHN